jgi:hypothetical protein
MKVARYEVPGRQFPDTLFQDFGELSRIASFSDSSPQLQLSTSPRSSTETLVVFLSFPTHYMLWSHVTGLYALSEVRQFGRQSNRLSLR